MNETILSGPQILRNVLGSNGLIEIKDAGRNLGVLSIVSTSSISLSITYTEAAAGYMKEKVVYTASITGSSYRERYKSDHFSYKRNKCFVDRFIELISVDSIGINKAYSVMASAIIESARTNNLFLGIRTHRPSRSLVSYIRLFGGKVIYEFNGDLYTLDLDGPTTGKNGLANKNFSVDNAEKINILSSLIYFE